MAMQRWRAIKRCYADGKLFKIGAEIPMSWIDAGYEPNPEWFVPSQDYDDHVRQQAVSQGKIRSAGADPRPTKILIDELSKRMGDIPKNWNRAKIWAALTQREMAESRSEPVRKPGRPAKEV